MKTLSRLFLLMCVALIFAFGIFTNTSHCQSPPTSTASVNKSGILHISRSSTVPTSGLRFLVIWGTIDGAKVELMATYGSFSTRIWTVAPGDYPVQMTRDEKTDRGIVRDYEVELTPGKRQTFVLSGLTE